MKRPSDKQIKISKILLGLILILIAVIALRVQNLIFEDSIFWIALDATSKEYFSYFILGLWVIPIVLGGLDINILSRGRTRILQIVFWVFLMILSGMFVETPTLSVKTGQKITKIRV